MEEKDIESLVFEVLEDILKPSLDDIIFRRPRKQIKKTDKLISDLKMDSDDSSILFIPELERRLGIDIPSEEWRKVFTVQDVIDLLKKYHKRK